jgi:hypothetical protein
VDINALSREMYEGIPAGGTLFTVDKVGLQIATKYINKSCIEPWKTANMITILTFGETTHINIHAEFEVLEEHLGKKCFDAICLLMFQGVFTSDFSFSFLQCFQSLFPFIIFDKSYFVPLLSTFFKIVEWEWAWDFLDNPLYLFLNSAINEGNNFRRHKNSNYSKDGKVIRRIKERNGKQVSLSKGRQQSLINIYRRDKKIKSDRSIERVELRQQGLYKKDLSFDFLNGTKEEAVNKAIIVLKKSVNKVINNEAIKLADYWKKNAPREFIEVFSVSN